MRSDEGQGADKYQTHSNHDVRAQCFCRQVVRASIPLLASFVALAGLASLATVDTTLHVLDLVSQGVESSRGLVGIGVDLLLHGVLRLGNAEGIGLVLLAHGFLSSSQGCVQRDT